MFTTLDGVVADPDGTDGTAGGGWAFRHGPGAVAGDKFQLGETLDNAVLLFGRRTWQLFTRIWPARSDEFSTRMNAVDKLVVTRTGVDPSIWSNSTVIDGDLIECVRFERARRDVIIIGSISVIRELQRHNLVDEYRLLTLPSVLGAGERLFAADGPAVQLRCTHAEQPDVAVLTWFEVTR